MKKGKKKDNFIKICKIISWLDEIRWKQKVQDTFTNEVLKNNNLRPAQKILTHWLLYITNRGKKAEVLWKNNTSIIKKLVEDYFKENYQKKEDVIKLYEKWIKKYSEDSKKNKIQGYPADLESIKRTLILLLDYNKDIIFFMTRRFPKRKEDPKEVIPRVAFSLYLLSYQSVQSFVNNKKLKESQKQDKLNKEMNNAKDILNKDDIFEGKFKKWDDGGERWHKRTWAALRDYKKSKALLKVFIEGIRNNADKDIWKRDFTKQLELPGDIWNIRFFENCIKPIAKGEVTGNAPQVVRELWDKISSECPKSYPEQFDITFDFSPRMCSKRLCDVCPFGPKGAKSICIPTDDKYCPVALVVCGYIHGCKQDGCPIKDDIGKGICYGFKQLN